MENITTMKRARKLYRAHVRAKTNTHASFKSACRDWRRLGIIPHDVPAGKLRHIAYSWTQFS